MAVREGNRAKIRAIPANIRGIYTGKVNGIAQGLIRLADFEQADTETSCRIMFRTTLGMVRLRIDEQKLVEIKVESLIELVQEWPDLALLLQEDKTLSRLVSTWWEKRPRQTQQAA